LNENNYCLDCKKRISRTSIRCKSCAKKGKLNSHFGILQTKKAKRKISEKNKGKMPWNKGLKGVQISPRKGTKLSDETKQRISNTRKKRQIPAWNKGKKRPKFSEEWKKNLSKSQLGRKHLEETKEKISKANTGEMHHNWLGGTSLDGYAVGWNKTYKNIIRTRDKYTCQYCMKTRTIEKRAFPVHHIDYDKQNINEQNLITLCLKCHNKTNNIYNREYWTNIFTKKIKLIYKEKN